MVTRRSAPTKKTSTVKFASKRTYPKKKTSVVKKVASLARQVKKLNTVSYDKVSTLTTIAANEALTSTVNIYRLSYGLNAVVPVWGYNNADIQQVDKAYLNRKDVMVSIRQSNEPNLIRYTMMVVSLKDQGADSTTFDPATGNLNLTIGTHFTVLGADQYRVSPRFFNIHMVRRFTMGYEGSAGPTADTRSERRFNFSITPKQKLIQNPKGNVFLNSAFTFPKDPSQNYFLLVFNDNSSADLESNKIDSYITDNWAIAS